MQLIENAANSMSGLSEIIVKHVFDFMQEVHGKINGIKAGVADHFQTFAVSEIFAGNKTLHRQFHSKCSF